MNMEGGEGREMKLDSKLGPLQSWIGNYNSNLVSFRNIQNHFLGVGNERR